MKRYLWLCLLVALALVGGARVRAASALTVRITTNPPVQAIIPDETFTTTTLDLRDAEGNPIEGLVWLHLAAPQPPRLLGTDFPYVEGSQLLDIPALAQNGRVEVGLVYPIRGAYTFDVEAQLPNGDRQHARATLTIGENPAERRNFLALLGGLLGVGLAAGLLIGRSAPRLLVLAACALLAGLWSAPVAAHGGEHETPPAENEWSYETPTFRIEGAFDATEAVVGTPFGFHLNVIPLNNQPLPAGRILVEAIHTEDETPIYRFTMPLQAGHTHAAMHLFDGAPHRLRFTVLYDETGESFTDETILPVRGVSPPFWVKVRALLILLTPLLAGMLAGYGLARRTQRRLLAGAHV